jgi:pSer/pThr/pTyr-binding forkhead associated (FHA) protein
MDVDEVRGELEDLGQETFIQRYGRFFLVLTDPDSLDEFASFVNTASREAHEITSGTRMDHVDIRPILPRKKGAVRVTVGREDADIELVHRKVSKLHASFVPAGGIMSLIDEGSKNGTWVNGKMLPPEQQVPIDVGDTLAFGSIGATLWGIEDLLAAVKES